MRRNTCEPCGISFCKPISPRKAGGLAEFHFVDVLAYLAQAKAKAGNDVGVPLIVLDGGEGQGFFGPVFSPAPTGKDAVTMWDAMVAAGRIPGFYEFKRSRSTGPIFGERPAL